MKYLKQGLDFYINSSIHVALSVVSLTYITLMEFKLPFDKVLLGFVFFASVTGYNFVKYFGTAKSYYRQIARWLKYIQWFSFFCSLFMLGFMLQLKIKTLLYICGFGVVTFLYAIPFLPKRFYLDHKHNLRSVRGIKVYLIGLVWAGVTVFLPLENNGYNGIDSHVTITAVQRFVFVIALMLPFEIRDMQFDSLKLATIPQKIGVKKTKILGFVLMKIFVLLEFLKADFLIMNFIELGLVATLTLLLILGATKTQKKYYSSFWVEAVPVVWLLLVLLDRHFF
ncbi:MAG: hypothetical protein ACK5MZ_02360 [Aestuariibaculum sp.]